MNKAGTTWTLHECYRGAHLTENTERSSKSACSICVFEQLLTCNSLILTVSLHCLQAFEPGHTTSCEGRKTVTHVLHLMYSFLVCCFASTENHECNYAVKLM